MNDKRPPMRRILLILLALCLFQTPALAAGSGISLSLKKANIEEVMQMLSKQQRINVLLGPGVDGEVSLNLYDTPVDQAIRAIASAGGFVVERRQRSYFIMRAEDSGKYSSGTTEVRSYAIRYTDPNEVEGVVRNHLSSLGKVKVLSDRRMLIVEDTSEFQHRIKALLRELDKRPRQILIEAHILQIQLDDGDSFGFDWTKLFNSDGGTGSFGVQGFNGSGTTGLFLQLSTPDINVALNALRNETRVRTLSTPKLLALENQEASVIIGNRLGYKVTTTINQVTTESIEFLESGVILKVTPSVDDSDRILLDIHPEVSDGDLPGGIPRQNTTEVTTQVLVGNGQTVFIGGLLKQKDSDSSNRVRGLSRIPLFGKLFGSEESSFSNTETIVMITPRIVDLAVKGSPSYEQTRMSEQQRVMAREKAEAEATVNTRFEPVPTQDSSSWNHSDDVVW